MDEKLRKMIQEDNEEFVRRRKAQGGGLGRLCITLFDLTKMGGWLVKVHNPRPALRAWLHSPEVKDTYRMGNIFPRSDKKVEFIIRKDSLMSFIEAARNIIARDDKRIKEVLRQKN